MGEALPEDRYIDVGDVTTRYWMAGEEGSVVLLLHGVGCHVEFWEKNIAALAQEHRVFAVDIVGFGRTDKPDGFYSSEQMAYMAEFILDFMTAMDVTTASLVGNSMGGGVSIKVAAHSPRRVERLVLVDSAGLGKRISSVLRFMTVPFLGEVLSRPGRQSAARMMKMVSYDWSRAGDDFIDRSAAINRMPGNQRSLLSVLRDEIDMFGMKDDALADFSSCLEIIDAPILVIWGRQDRILPVADAESAVGKMVDGRLHIIDQAGHSPQIDRPDEFNATVLDFLRD